MLPGYDRMLLCLAGLLVWSAVASASAASAAGTAQAPPEGIKLWPAGAPGAVGDTPADVPMLHVHKAPADKAVGTAVVICPGGGYANVMMSYEGHEVARWFNAMGVTAFVLRYRTAPRYRHSAPLQDLQRAIRHVRAGAEGFGVAKDRIGVMGFSAGGHLAASSGTLFAPNAAGDPNAADPIDRVSARPDFSILAYPVITMDGPYAHRGSRDNLLGKDADAKAVDAACLERQVTKDTPPAFLFHTNADTAVPPENSVMFYTALRKAGVPAELHIYRQAGHGVGLNRHPAIRTWPDELKNWLEHSGWLKPIGRWRPLAGGEPCGALPWMIGGSQSGRQGRRMPA